MKDGNLQSSVVIASILSVKLEIRLSIESDSGVEGYWFEERGAK